MIKRIFITLYLLTLVCVSVRADEPSIKISLGIRDTKFFTREEITNTPYPLAFRIQNTGETVISIGQARDLFFSGYIHVKSEDGKQEDASFKRFDWIESYGLVPPDLKPGDTFENAVIVNLLTFFPFIKDGDYQVFWSLGRVKSDDLHFRVTDGKVQLIKPNA
jgi:hypothetical protein